MKVELHLIQNHVPSSLNRDINGVPKDALFGGYKRARLSSQAQKRAERFFRGEDSARTQRLMLECADLLEKRGKDHDAAEKAATVAVNTALPKKDGRKAAVDTEDGRTQYSLFIGLSKLNELADLCEKYWDLLGAGKPSEEAKEALNEFFKNDKAVDLAIYGRMLADVPDFKRNSSVQVAHAISTHAIEVESDWFSTVDDLLPPDKTGASYMDTSEFNSPCYYRYAVLDVDHLAKELGDVADSKEVTTAFVRAFILSIPTGKQNAYASHNLPSMALAVVKDGVPANLGNAFQKPIKPKGNKGLVEASVDGLLAYWEDLAMVYGSALGIKASPWFLAGVKTESKTLADERVVGLDELVAKVKEAL